MTPPETRPPLQPASARGRLAFAASMLVVLGATVVIVTLSGEGDEVGAIAAGDVECLRAWNESPDQIAFGVHQVTGHGYGVARIQRLDARGAPTEDGRCAIAFAGQALDPEPAAAAQVMVGESWKALSKSPVVSPDRLQELQQDAAENPNVTLTTDGRLVERQTGA
jgi:hypothetical protein